MTTKSFLDGRPVEVEIQMEKHTCDSYVLSATYLDDFSEVEDDGLDILNESLRDTITEYALENGIYNE